MCPKNLYEQPAFALQSQFASTRFLAGGFLSAFLLLFVACGGGGSDLYIYNSKREIGSDFPKMVEAFRAEYQEKTGEELNIKVFAGHDDKDTILKADMSNVNVSEQPTIYYIDQSKLPDYAASGQVLDLKTEAVRQMNPAFYNDLVMPIKVGESLTTDGENSFGIPFNYEGFGYYISSKTLGELFGLSGAALGSLIEDLKMSSYEEFIGFCIETEKWIADPQSALPVVLSGNSYALAAEKGAETQKLAGIFSMRGSEGWAWGFHLYNKSLNLEFSSAYVTSAAKTLEWRGAESYYNLLKFQFDHMSDPTPEEKEITKGSYGSELATEAYNYNASLALFAQGKALMIKQGNWSYTGIAESATQGFLDTLFFVPVKYDLNTPAVQAMSEADWQQLSQVKGDSKAEKMANFNKSITIFVPNYLVINAKADEKKQKLAMEFLHWMQTSQTGLQYLVETFAFIPYYPLPDNVKIENPISQSILEYAGRGLSLANDMNGTPSLIHDDMQEWIFETYLAPSDASLAGFQGFDDFQAKIVNRFIEEWAERVERRDSAK